MELPLLLSFLGMAVALTLMPGPDILFVISQSISQNSRAGISTALGLCTGLFVHISAATAGLSAIIYQSGIIFSLIKYAGAVYLLYLAWQAFKSKTNRIDMNEQVRRSYQSLYKKGIIMNVLNPKVSLFFLALLPQFVNEGSWNATVQMLTLGVIFLVQAFVIFSTVSVFSAKVRSWLIHHDWFAERMNLIEGIVLTMIGIQVAISSR
ncbi:LysE family translocator [Halobacillus yeomjeoni]|uniref:LysE family translocator n=1 Tax=Halobacillus yeomjeoni TaxID=311194 RepID=A0A931MUU9_9BACI|nr:LysE family translocator [Halobacillus yeomjeoni]MBH0229694.1 LysE family translocator [Halobacillus yeomjeoni]